MIHLEIGDSVKVHVENDGIDTIDTTKVHEVFNFITTHEGEEKVGIKRGKYWYYVSPSNVSKV